jgi:rubrerythrin
MAEYTQQQRDHFVEEFARRRKRQFLLTLPVAVAAFAFILLADKTKDAESAGRTMVLMPLAMVALLGLIIFSLKNWRCPACHSYLGREISPRFCPRCGAQLMDR